MPCNYLIFLGMIGLFGLNLIPISPFVNYEWMPVSVLTALPALAGLNIYGSAGLWMATTLTASITPILFFFAALRAKKVSPTPHVVSVTIFTTVCILSCILSLAMWGEAVAANSLFRAQAIAVQAFIPPIIVILAFIIYRKNMSLRRSLIIHWIALAWLSWSAFPWWGEFI